MEDKALDKVQYVSLAVDIHHIFPQKWCARQRHRRRAPREHRQQDRHLGTSRTEPSAGPPRRATWPSIEKKRPDQPRAARRPARSTTWSRRRYLRS
ncbi:MAG: hypothetical protein V9G10_01120 [Candidatus Nanopelagicales bacterium]